MAGKKLGRNTVFKIVGGEMKTQFSDTGAEVMRTKISHFRTQANDFEAVFNEFDPYFMGSIRRNFQAQGRPRRWPELAQSTQRDRERQGYPAARPILVRSGALMRGFYSRIGKRSYAVRNRQPYFNYHQLGQGHNPKREMVVVLRGHRAHFTELAREHLGIE